MRCTLVFLALSGASFAAAAGDLPFKQVAAPPEDILSGRVRLPEPEACATTSGAALIPVELAWTSEGRWSFETPVFMTAAGRVSLAIVSPDAGAWTLELHQSDGTYAAIQDALGTEGVERRTQALDADLPGWGIDRVDVERASAGAWRVRVRAPDASASARPAPGWLIVRDASPIAIAAHTSTLATLSDREIGIVAHVYDAEDGDSARALPGLARSGTAVVETADGTRRIALFDDGLHADGEAGDGVFGALLPRWTSGGVRARVELEGIAANGARFVRTVQLDFAVIEPRTVFSGLVATRIADAQRLRIELGGLALGPAGQLHVSAEVWGTDPAGELVPVCWLSRMVMPEERDGEWQLPLFLDARWIERARASAPFALRNARVQDPDTHVPYDSIDWLPLSIAALPPMAGQTATPPAIMTSMLMSPAQAQATAAQSVAGNPFPRHLMLVHGYCSGGSIWPAADFTQPKLEFLDPNQNRTHDQFAQLLLNKLSTRHSFGVVAHSQGAQAALHLYTYYYSGLDNASGGRRIQSLAAPYQGTPLAALGAFSCGVNNDMTPAGSATWLAGIPTWARAEVWYWTTSDAGSACNFLTGLLLTNPEDGTVEQFRCQLPGANSIGHVTGWCHTTGMTYPASYTDHTRNADMNANAAR